MNSTRTVAVVLMIIGVLGLAYGGFSYTEDTHEANIGSMKLSIDEKRRVNIPVWAGVGALLAGGLMFASGLKKS